MRLLLDTHALLWAWDDPDELSREAREAIESYENQIHVSVISLWEMATKISLNKLRLKKTLAEKVKDNDLSFHFFDVTLDDSLELAELTSFSHHRDPFDRMLVAQAKRRKLTIVTRDKNIPKYGVKVMKA